jgi:hypothetical protein
MVPGKNRNLLLKPRRNFPKKYAFRCGVKKLNNLKLMKENKLQFSLIWKAANTTAGGLQKQELGK